jgi:hypothetical protein
MMIEFFSLFLLHPVSSFFNQVHFQIAASPGHVLGEFWP